MADNHELAVERILDAPIDAVWRAVTEHLEQWWCPKPWTTELVEMDLRPGGRFCAIMRGPAGEGGEPMEGILLDVVPERRLVFTNILDSHFDPQNSPVANIVGRFEFAPEGHKTRYRASARHWDAESARKHDEMGFTQGWSAVADQLEAVAQGLAEKADA